MRLTKYTHSCVRLVHDDGGVLVVDPGEWSEPAALEGADAVLVTHEHEDHVDVLRLRGAGLPVYAPAGADLGGLPVIEVATGEEFSVAGFRIRATGGVHAPVHGGKPSCPNLGYVIDDLYYPGDALTPPGEPVDTVLVPVQASWLKTADAIDFLLEVAPRRAYGVHDGQVNERGRGSINAWYAREGGTRYRWLAPGETA
ncbi:MBL fold metallo-hydrolase [Streptomyces sp. MN03-5084-2B]|nr:MBL fold metallo-hydrolase [Streptomyces sp. MN03-5084-2B]